MGAPKQEKESVEGMEEKEVEVEKEEEKEKGKEKEKKEKKEKTVPTTEEKKEGRGQIRSHPLELASGYQLLLSGRESRE